MREAGGGEPSRAEYIDGWIGHARLYISGGMPYFGRNASIWEGDWRSEAAVYPGSHGRRPGLELYGPEQAYMSGNCLNNASSSS